MPNTLGIRKYAPLNEQRLIMHKSIQLKEMEFLYTFEFTDNSTKTFRFSIDPKSLIINEDKETSEPEWTKMENFKCQICPLSSDEKPHCPLAKQLVNVIDFFSDFPSFHEAKVVVQNYERIIYKHTTVQLGVGSLMGIIMASSGCPIIGRLKPLVKFHLPFASLEETEYRVLAMYVLSQYFRYMRTGQADWNLERLRKGYKEIQDVNRNIVEKLSEVEMSDASRNAVVTLSNFAEYILLNLEGKEYDELVEHLRLFEEF